jgi:hypothetical protein
MRIKPPRRCPYISTIILGLTETSVCVVDDTGKVLREWKVSTEMPVGGFDMTLGFLIFRGKDENGPEALLEPLVGYGARHVRPIRCWAGNRRGGCEKYTNRRASHRISGQLG